MAAALFPDPHDVRQPGPLTRWHSRVFGGSFAADRPSGRSVAFRRSAWERVGGFPEELRFAEDTAFGLRVGDGGRCVVQTDAPVVWRQRDGWWATARMFAAYGRGDGMQGERIVVIRNSARALAALAAPVLLIAGGPAGRRAVLLGAAAYASLPAWRVRHAPQPVRTAALVPVALATQDAAKAYGFTCGVLTSRFSPR